jgi:hypothetical protein
LEILTLFVVGFHESILGYMMMMLARDDIDLLKHTISTLVEAPTRSFDWHIFLWWTWHTCMRIHLVVVLVHGWHTFLVQVVIHVDVHVWYMFG